MDPDELQKQIDDVYSNLLTLIKLQDQAKREQKQNTLLQQSKSQLDSQKRNSNEKITTTTTATGSKTKVSTKRLDDIFEYDDFDYVSNGRLAKGSFLDTHMPKSNSRLRQSKLSTSGQSSVRFTMPSATGSKYETLNRVKTKYQPQTSVTVPQFPSSTGTSTSRNNTKSSFHKCRTKTKKGQRTVEGNSSNENLSAELQSESEAFMDVDNSSSSMPSLSPNHNNNVGFESSQIKQSNKQGKIKSSTWVSTNNRKVGNSSMAVVSYSHPPTLFDSASNRVGSTISTSTSVTTSSTTTTNRKQPLTSLFQGPPRDDNSSSPVSGGSSTTTTTSLSVSQPDRANALMMPQATTGGGGNSYYCNLLTNEFREKNQLVVATIQKQGSLTKKAIEERNKVLLKISDIRKQMVGIIKDVPRILATTKQSQS